jgi:two-component system OmpR family sensor kinase
MRVDPEADLPLVETLERLLGLPSADLANALSSVSDIFADATKADKVDAFLFQPEKSTLVAIGSSHQPLSALQKRLGLDILPVANGGRVVYVYETGRTFVTGHLEDDSEELRGIKEGLKIRSKIGVPLEVGGERRGMLMIASLQPDFFNDKHVRFVESVARWVGIIVHRAELIDAIAASAMEQGRRAVAEELVTVVAHDFRNIMTPLEMRLAMLKQRADRDGREADVRDLDSAQHSFGRLRDMVGEILDVARIDQGVFSVELCPVDLGELLKKTVQAMSSPEHPIDTKIVDKLIVVADSARIRQCLENVISNAQRHSPKGSVIAISAVLERRIDGDYARVDIVDEGPGVSAELGPQIFERFAQGRGKRGSLGLGLFLAKRIATLHEGDLTVESSTAKGARFALLLPFHQELH